MSRSVLHTNNPSRIYHNIALSVSNRGDELLVRGSGERRGRRPRDGADALAADRAASDDRGGLDAERGAVGGQAAETAKDEQSAARADTAAGMEWKLPQS